MGIKNSVGVFQHYFFYFLIFCLLVCLFDILVVWLFGVVVFGLWGYWEEFSV
jgi:hypothetical protein